MKNDTRGMTMGPQHVAPATIETARMEAIAEDITRRDASHLNLINHMDEKTGASVGMYRGVMAFPIEWGKISK